MKVERRVRRGKVIMTKIVEMPTYTVFLPEANVPYYMIAMLDDTGWVTVGATSGDSTLLIDRDEWPHFVRFINDIAQHIDGMPNA